LVRNFEGISISDFSKILKAYGFKTDLMTIVPPLYSIFQNLEYGIKHVNENNKKK
jgi:hypothetical protein